MIYEVPKIVWNFNGAILKKISQKYNQAFQVAYNWPIHPLKFWSPLALICVSVLPKSFGLSCFLDIFPGKVVQPGPPIIYTWDVSRSCARRLSPQANYSNTAKHTTIQNISWLKKNSRSKRRTPEYPVVQYCGVTTSIFLFPCLERASGKRQGHFMDELLMGEKTSHKEICN